MCTLVDPKSPLKYTSAETSNKKPILFTNYFLLPFKSNEKIAIFSLFLKKPEIKVQLEQHMFFATWLSLFHISVWWNAVTTDSS